jgi:hypothetical protein
LATSTILSEFKKIVQLAIDGGKKDYGKLGRVWVFDRGIVSEENLSLLRSRGASYLVATPKRLLAKFQKDLIAEDWAQVANHPQIEVKRIERDGELYVLTRSLARAEKRARNAPASFKGLVQRSGQTQSRGPQRTGCPEGTHLHKARRLAERWPSAWSYLKDVTLTETELVWRWDLAIGFTLRGLLALVNRPQGDLAASQFSRTTVA